MAPQVGGFDHSGGAAGLVAASQGGEQLRPGVGFGEGQSGPVRVVALRCAVPDVVVIGRVRLCRERATSRTIDLAGRDYPLGHERGKAKLLVSKDIRKPELFIS